MGPGLGSTLGDQGNVNHGVETFHWLPLLHGLSTILLPDVGRAGAAGGSSKLYEL